MAGIVKSTKKRIVANKKIREIVTPTATLDTDLFFSDLSSIGGTNTPGNFTAEFSRLPSIVKNEAELVMTIGSRSPGQIRAMNGNTKTVEILSFSRASDGMSTFGNGGIALNGIDMPRPEYNPTNGQLKGYLFEPASTNLFFRSNLTNGISDLSIIAGPVTNISDVIGTGILSKGVKLAPESTVANSYPTLDKEKYYTLSMFVKPEDGNSPTNAMKLIFFGAAVNFNVIPLSNGVYRIWYTGKPFSGAGIGASTVGSTRTVNITCIQLEEGELSSYIPTTDTATATRLSDKLVGTRPISIFPFNSWYLESDLWTGWFGNGVDKTPFAGRNYFATKSFNIYSQYYTGTLVAGLLRVIRVSPTTTTLVCANTMYGRVDFLGGNIFTFSGYVRVNGAIPTALKDGGRLNTQSGSSVNLTYDKTTGYLVATHNYGASTSWFIHTDLFADFINVGDIITISGAKFELGSVATPWAPAPEDIATVDVNGNLEVSSTVPVCIRSLALVARQLKQSEV